MQIQLETCLQTPTDGTRTTYTRSDAHPPQTHETFSLMIFSTITRSLLLREGTLEFKHSQLILDKSAQFQNGISYSLTFEYMYIKTQTCFAFPLTATAG